ncbi:Myb-like dna-binding protein, partial [Globisporangium splendens]
MSSEGVWSQEEHGRYLEALQLYPHGPWKSIAQHVGTQSVRQMQTHAQKYHEKIVRHLRGLRKERKKLLRPEHRIDDEVMDLCCEVENERLSIASSASSSTSGIPHTPSLWHHYDTRSEVGGEYYYPRHSHSSHSDFQEYEYLHPQRQHNGGQSHPSHSFDSNHVAEEHAGTNSIASPRRHGDLPSFSDCMDFLIEFFGSRQINDTTWYRQHQRRR